MAKARGTSTAEPRANHPIEREASRPETQVEASWTARNGGETIRRREFPDSYRSETPIMKQFILILLLGAAAIWTSAALATPSQGQSSTILSIGALQADLAFNTGLTPDPDGVTWGSTAYTSDQLPEFLSMLRNAGVTSLGYWLNLHPAVAAKFGMAPVELLNAPEVVTQQTTFAPGATSGWHSHPGYLTATVVSGQVVRYGADCSPQPFAAGQSFYETGATAFVVKNEGTTPAVVIVTFVVPGGTPTTGLRLDKPQPPTCQQ